MSATLAEMGSDGVDFAADVDTSDPKEVLDSALMEARKLAAESVASWRAAGALILTAGLGPARMRSRNKLHHRRKTEADV